MVESVKYGFSGQEFLKIKSDCDNPKLIVNINNYKRLDSDLCRYPRKNREYEI